MNMALVASVLAGIFATSVHAAPVNLVTNGNFEAGNTQFTSNYSYSPGGNSTEGEYTVRSNPFPWNGAFVSISDHTPGVGNDLMMVANGSPVSGATVWKSQSIAVTAGTKYFFEAFVNNVCCSSFSFGPGSESILEFSLSLDGGPAISLGTITTNLALAGTWEGLSTQFQAGLSGNVELSLVNRNTNRGGNDFAIDDVFFGTESTVNPPPPPTVAEPFSILLLGTSIASMAIARRRASTKHRRN